MPSIYHSLEYNGSGNIVGPIYQHSNYDYIELLFRSERDKFKDPKIIKYDFTGEEIELLDTVWDRYKNLSDIELSELNHKENTPWTKVWNEMKKGEVKLIPDNLIKEHFISLARKNSTRKTSYEETKIID